MISGRGVATMIALAAAMPPSPEPDPAWLDEINIFEEYELIQQKKSKLSRVKRDKIVRLRESLIK